MKHKLFASVLSLAVASVSGAALAQTQVTTQSYAQSSAGVTASVVVNQPGFVQTGYVGQPGVPVAQPAYPVAQPAYPVAQPAVPVAPPPGYGPRPGMGMGMGMGMGRDQREVRDDFRDLRRFQNALGQFDMAVQMRDTNAVHISLMNFVQMGRAEVMELQREVQLAAQEAARSAQFAAGGMGGRRSSWDDQRDFAAEQQRLMQASQALNQLEQAANANYTFGPQVPILMQARDAMNRFVALAQMELQASMRELREDRRAGGWGVGNGYNAYGQVGFNGGPAPVFVAQPAVVPPPVVVMPPPRMRRNHWR